MSALDNISIGIKSLIAPIVSSLLGVVIGVVFYMASQSISQETRQSQFAASFASSVANVELLFNNVQTNVYKAIYLKQMNVENKQIDEILAGVIVALNEMRETLKGLDYAALGNRIDRAKVDDLLTQINEYEKTYKELESFIREDVSMASIYLNSCLRLFGNAQAILKDFQKIASGAVNSASEALQAELQRSLVTVLACIALMVFLSLFMGFLIGGAVSRPVRKITGMMQDLSSGNKAIEVLYQKRKDEIGGMACALQVFKENAIEMDRLKVEQERAEKKAAEDRRKMMNQLADDFESSVAGVVQNVAGAARELEGSSKMMAELSSDANSRSTTVAAAAEEATSNVQAVAGATEELSSSVDEIGRQVVESAKAAEGAVRDAQMTSDVVTGLASAATRISEVVNLINDIASQTNLLALNATIEAARAGDAGKGFAVVANEVKTLATQTGRATEEISQHIGAVQAETKKAVEAIESVSGSIKHVHSVSAAIASAVQEQTAATKEIARNIEQAAVGTQEVSSNIVGVSEAVRRVGDSAHTVLDASQLLSADSETMKAKVKEFVAKVRGG